LTARNPKKDGFDKCKRKMANKIHLMVRSQKKLALINKKMANKIHLMARNPKKDGFDECKRKRASRILFP
jgi:hypothetical protein